MIVPMKKIAVIVQSKDADSALRKLRFFGALHLVETAPVMDKNLAILSDEFNQLAQAIDILKKVKSDFGKHRDLERISKWEKDVRELCLRIIDTWKRYLRLQEFSRELQSTIEAWQVWGDFDPVAIQNLAQKGLNIKLYRLSENKISSLPKGIVCQRIASRGSVVFCALISQGPLDIGLKEEGFPRKGLSQFQEELKENERTKNSLKEELLFYTQYLDFLNKKKEVLSEEIEFSQVLSSMGGIGVVRYILGFLPFDLVDELRRLAKNEGWGLFITEPAEDDPVPTLIRNPRIISWIFPVFKFIEITPGYNEIDVSFPFLIFLAIFFGIIIGDAGYGLVYFFLTFLAYKRWKGKLKDLSIFYLAFGLSLFAIVWGLLNATFFGQSWLLARGLRPLIPALGNTDNIQVLCFFIGAFHLTLAHLLKAFRRFPAWAILADLGWIAILWSAFFLAQNLVLFKPMPNFFKPLLTTGIILILFYAEPKRGLFRRLGLGLQQILLNLVNNFTDVVSYIRLFAVGLAGVAIADNFNAMAAGINKNSLWALFASVLIVVLGHILNLILAPLSVVIHGLRLNILEFSQHAGITWGGKPYRPFKQKPTSLNT